MAAIVGTNYVSVMMPVVCPMHVLNYSTKDLDWMLKNLVLVIGVVDNWNCLYAHCVTSDTFNTFKKHVSVELDPETVNQ